VASLLARLSRPGRGAAARRSLPTPWLTVLASAAVLVTAVVGLAAAVVVVQTLDPGGGLSVGASARLAARLLVLAQGGRLQLDTGPLVLAPLLLTLALAWGLSRAARSVVRAGSVDGGAAVARLTAVVVAVHVALTVVVAVVADGAGARVGWLRTIAGAAVLAVVAAGWGALRESGLWAALLGRLPGPVGPMLRGILTGLLTAMALCTLVVAVALASDARGYAALTASLGGAGAGAVGLLGLSALLLPNAAAAALGLAAGPGFTVGSATLVSVHGVTLGAVPALPLLAALPDTQAVPLLAFVSQAVPAVAGLVAGATVGRWLPAEDGGSIVAGLSGILTGVGLGIVSALVVAVAGGSLGSGGLADVGAPALATGLAVGAQSGIAAALAAVVVRWRSQRWARRPASA
jgi:hypothetical protein